MYVLFFFIGDVLASVVLQFKIFFIYTFFVAWNVCSLGRFIACDVFCLGHYIDWRFCCFGRVVPRMFFVSNVMSQETK
jgi:hypothetical protein